jgi:hypothetical protein
MYSISSLSDKSLSGFDDDEQLLSGMVLTSSQLNNNVPFYLSTTDSYYNLYETPYKKNNIFRSVKYIRNYMLAIGYYGKLYKSNNNFKTYTQIDLGIQNLLSIYTHQLGRDIVYNNYDTIALLGYDGQPNRNLYKLRIWVSKLNLDSGSGSGSGGNSGGGSDSGSDSGSGSGSGSGLGEEGHFSGTYLDVDGVEDGTEIKGYFLNNKYIFIVNRNNIYELPFLLVSTDTVEWNLYKISDITNTGSGYAGKITNVSYSSDRNLYIITTNSTDIYTTSDFIIFDRSYMVSNILNETSDYLIAVSPTLTLVIDKRKLKSYISKIRALNSNTVDMLKPGSWVIYDIQLYSIELELWGKKTLEYLKYDSFNEVFILITNHLDILYSKDGVSWQVIRVGSDKVNNKHIHVTDSSYEEEFESQSYSVRPDLPTIPNDIEGNLVRFLTECIITPGIPSTFVLYNDSNHRTQPFNNLKLANLIGPNTKIRSVTFSYEKLLICTSDHNVLFNQFNTYPVLYSESDKVVTDHEPYYRSNYYYTHKNYRVYYRYYDHDIYSDIFTSESFYNYQDYIKSYLNLFLFPKSIVLFLHDENYIKIYYFSNDYVLSRDYESYTVGTTYYKHIKLSYSSTNYRFTNIAYEDGYYVAAGYNCIASYLDNTLTRYISFDLFNGGETLVCSGNHRFILVNTKSPNKYYTAEVDFDKNAIDTWVPKTFNLPIKNIVRVKYDLYNNYFIIINVNFNVYVSNNLTTWTQVYDSGSDAVLANYLADVCNLLPVHLDYYYNEYYYIDKTHSRYHHVNNKSYKSDFGGSVQVNNKIIGFNRSKWDQNNYTIKEYVIHIIDKPIGLLPNKVPYILTSLYSSYNKTDSPYNERKVYLKPTENDIFYSIDTIGNRVIILGCDDFYYDRDIHVRTIISQVSAAYTTTYTINYSIYESKDFGETWSVYRSSDLSEKIKLSVSNKYKRTFTLIYNIYLRNNKCFIQVIAYNIVNNRKTDLCVYSIETTNFTKFDVIYILDNNDHHIDFVGYFPVYEYLNGYYFIPYITERHGSSGTKIGFSITKDFIKYTRSPYYTGGQYDTSMIGYVLKDYTVEAIPFHYKYNADFGYATITYTQYMDIEDFDYIFFNGEIYLYSTISYAVYKSSLLEYGTWTDYRLQLPRLNTVTSSYVAHYYDNYKIYYDEIHKYLYLYVGPEVIFISYDGLDWEIVDKLDKTDDIRILKMSPDNILLNRNVKTVPNSPPVKNSSKYIIVGGRMPHYYTNGWSCNTVTGSTYDNLESANVIAPNILYRTMVYTGKSLVALGANGVTYRSTDNFRTYTTSVIPVNLLLPNFDSSAQFGPEIAYGNGVLMMVGIDYKFSYYQSPYAKVWTSKDDGITWTGKFITPTGTDADEMFRSHVPSRLVYINNQFVFYTKVVYHRAYSNNNGDTWTFEYTINSGFHPSHSVSVSNSYLYDKELWASNYNRVTSMPYAMAYLKIDLIKQYGPGAIDFGHLGMLSQSGNGVIVFIDTTMQPELVSVVLELDLTPFSNYNSFGIGVRDPYNHIDYLLDLPNLLKDKNEFISRLLFDKIDRVFVIITNRLGVATSVDGINWVERRYDPNQNYRCQGATNDAVLINTNWSQLNLYYLILSNKLLILDNFNSTEYRKIEFDTDVVASDSSNSKLYIFTNDDKISIYDSALNLIDSHSLDSDYESIYNSFHDTIDYSSIKFVTIDDNTLVMFNTSYIRSNYVVSYKDLEGNDIDPPRLVRESR